MHLNLYVVSTIETVERGKKENGFEDTGRNLSAETLASIIVLQKKPKKPNHNKTHKHGHTHECTHTHTHKLAAVLNVIVCSDRPGGFVCSVFF